MKYIDTDKLRKEIEFAKSVYGNPQRVVHGIADAFMQDGRVAMCDDILKKLDSLQQEQPTCVEKTARISPGLISNFGTSTYVLDVDLTQDEMAKIAPFAFSSGKIKIKIVCE